MVPSAAGCSVRVAVRVRPLLSFEKTERLGECLSCIPQSKQLRVGDGGDSGRNSFTFDFTFPKACEQRTLYDDCVASLLEGELEAFTVGSAMLLLPASSLPLFIWCCLVPLVFFCLFRFLRYMWTLL